MPTHALPNPPVKGLQLVFTPVGGSVGPLISECTAPPRHSPRDVHSHIYRKGEAVKTQAIRRVTY